MLNRKALLVGALALLLTATAMASNFRAGDTVHLPAAGRSAGANNSFFKSDVFLSNLSSERVIVSVAFARNGAGDNSAALASAVPLQVLLPFERREINDFIKTVFNLDGGFGQLIFFACRENGNCDDCYNLSADCKLISVESRIYTATADGRTFGQLFSGIPWYNYVSVQATNPAHRNIFITGIREFGVAGTSGFRSNIGVANASQFTSTVLRVRLFNSTSQQFGNFYDITLGPLGTALLNVSAMFPGFSGTGYATIEQVSYTPVPGTASVDELAGFFAYGSVADNISNDPTTLESQYTTEMDQCVYTGTFSKTMRRPVRLR